MHSRTKILKCHQHQMYLIFSKELDSILPCLAFNSSKSITVNKRPARYATPFYNHLYAGETQAHCQYHLIFPRRDTPSPCAVANLEPQPL